MQLPAPAPSLTHAHPCHLHLHSHSLAYPSLHQLSHPYSNVPVRIHEGGRVSYPVPALPLGLAYSFPVFRPSGPFRAARPPQNRHAVHQQITGYLQTVTYAPRLFPVITYVLFPVIPGARQSSVFICFVTYPFPSLISTLPHAPHHAAYCPKSWYLHLLLPESCRLHISSSSCISVLQFEYRLSSRLSFQL